MARTPIKQQFARVSTEFSRQLGALSQGARKAWERETRAMGSILVNTVIRHTAPNRPSDGNAALKAGSPGISRLHKRIAQDFTGNDGGTPVTVYPIYHATAGRWMYRVKDRGAGTHGNFGIVVPVGRMPRKGPKPTVMRSAQELASWLQGHTDFRRNSKGTYRRRMKGGVREPLFASAGALRGLIRKQQKKAGLMLSGWAPASAALRKGGPVPGTHPRLGGSGGIDISRNPKTGRIEYTIWNDVTYGKGMDRVAGGLANRWDVYAAAEAAIRKQAARKAEAALKRKLNRPIRIK